MRLLRVSSLRSLTMLQPIPFPILLSLSDLRGLPLSLKSTRKSTHKSTPTLRVISPNHCISHG